MNAADGIEGVYGCTVLDGIHYQIGHPAEKTLTVIVKLLDDSSDRDAFEKQGGEDRSRP